MEYNKEVVQYILGLHAEGVLSHDIAKRTSNKFRDTVTANEVNLIVRAYQPRVVERKHWPVRVD